MTPDEIGKIFAEAADRALPTSAGDTGIRRAESAILTDLRPVRQLAPAWVWTLILVAMFSVFSATFAAMFGMHGLPVLSATQRALIFPALLAAGWLAAVACAREMRPAAGFRLDTVALALAVAGFPIVFSVVFHNYSTRDLLKEGIPCLVAGLCVSIPTGLVIAWILRRGFVLRWSAAGVAAGTLAGLTGLGMLELHCPNLKAIHVMIWHVAVVLVSGLLGFVFGRFADHHEVTRVVCAPQ